jgi:rhodanese-related sulfurtransferase
MASACCVSVRVLRFERPKPTRPSISIRPRRKNTHPISAATPGDSRFDAVKIEIVQAPGQAPNSLPLAATNHTCSKDAQALLTLVLPLVGDIRRLDPPAEVPDHLPQPTPGTLIHVLKKHPDHAGLDVRTGPEWQIRYIGGATSRPISERIANGVNPDKKHYTAAVRGSGHRGNTARHCLKSPGYEHVFQCYQRYARAECRAQQSRHIKQGATA